MDPKINDVLKIVEFYIELIENTETLKKLTMDSMQKMFQACVFIEKLINKVEEERKEADFESHVNALMAKKKKNLKYKCSDLKYASDKFLEVCLKEKKVDQSIVDELFKIYTKEYGGLRLEANINRILTHSMQANAILTTFKNLEFPKEDIEDEITIASWEHEINHGRHNKVKEWLLDMFNKLHIAKIIQLAYKSGPESKVYALIMDLFIKKLTDNHFLLYTELCCAKKKVILKLLENPKFQLGFIDQTFYIGRNMEEDEEEKWITESGFSYTDLKNIINILLDGPDDLHELTVDRIKLAKELNVLVWESIERDCIL